jgi:hypothetical protein
MLLRHVFRVAELTNTLRLTGLEIPLDIMFEEIAGGLSFDVWRSRCKPLEVVGSTTLIAGALEHIIASKEAPEGPPHLPGRTAREEGSRAGLSAG